MLPALFREQPRDDQGIVDDYFKPLLSGKPVVLTISDPRLPRKPRLTHGTFLVLTPLSMFGGPPDTLMVSLPGYGCEVLNMKTRARLLPFLAMGMSAFLSTALQQTINRTFHGGSHERTSTTSDKGSTRSTKRTRRKAAR